MAYILIVPIGAHNIFPVELHTDEIKIRDFDRELFATVEFSELAHVFCEKRKKI